jgi:hypothetical protein
MLWVLKCLKSHRELNSWKAFRSPTTKQKTKHKQAASQRSQTSKRQDTETGLDLGSEAIGSGKAKNGQLAGPLLLGGAGTSSRWGACEALAQLVVSEHRSFFERFDDLLGVP